MEIILCNSFKKRFLGLMGKKNIDYGLCFPRCNSIHTFFMKEPIDVVVTDRFHRVIYIKKNIGKNRILFPIQNGYYTYEFPAFSTDTQVGILFNPLGL